VKLTLLPLERESRTRDTTTSPRAAILRVVSLRGKDIGARPILWAIASIGGDSPTTVEFNLDDEFLRR
jgi:hypothetical protein